MFCVHRSCIRLTRASSGFRSEVATLVNLRSLPSGKRRHNRILCPTAFQSRGTLIRPSRPLHHINVGSDPHGGVCVSQLHQVCRINSRGETVILEWSLRETVDNLGILPHHASKLLFPSRRQISEIRLVGPSLVLNVDFLRTAFVLRPCKSERFFYYVFSPNHAAVYDFVEAVSMRLKKPGLASSSAGSFSSQHGIDMSNNFYSILVDEVLSHVVRHFQRRLTMFHGFAASLVESVRESFNRNQLMRLHPLQIALSTFQTHCNEVRTAIDQRPTPHALASAVLSQWPETKDPAHVDGIDRIPANLRKEAITELVTFADLSFENSRREIEEIENELSELFGNLKAVQDAARISLDSTRNALMKLNVRLTVLMAGVSFATFITSLFGMNLATGFEAEPGVFVFVSVLTISTIIASYFWTYLFVMRPIFAHISKPAVDQKCRMSFSSLNDPLYIRAVPTMPGAELQKHCAYAIGNVKGNLTPIERNAFIHVMSQDTHFRKQLGPIVPDHIDSDPWGYFD